MHLRDQFHFAPSVIGLPAERITKHRQRVRQLLLQPFPASCNLPFGLLLRETCQPVMAYRVNAKVDSAFFECSRLFPRQRFKLRRRADRHLDFCFDRQSAYEAPHVAVYGALILRTQLPCTLGARRAGFKLITIRDARDIDLQLSLGTVFEDVLNLVPPEPELSIHKTAGEEYRDWAVSLFKDRRGDLRLIEVAIVNGERDRAP